MGGWDKNKVGGKKKEKEAAGGGGCQGMGRQLLVGWEQWKPSEWHIWSGRSCLSVHP